MENLSRWEKLAQVHKLNFIAHKVGDTLLEPLRISGQHQGYNLTITVDYQRLTALFVLKPTDELMHSLFPKARGEPDLVEQAAGMLTLLSEQAHFEAPISFNHLPLELRYQASGLEGNEKAWRQVLQSLTRLATAACLLFVAEGRAVPYLLAAKAKASAALQPAISDLLTCISDRTGITLTKIVDRLWCPQCTTQFALNRVTVDNRALTFVGCRRCFQNHRFIDSRHRKVVNLIDQKMEAGLIDHDRLLVINWLAQRHFFDFDIIVIRQATDEDVERLVVQIGNQATPEQKQRFRHMRCYLAESCRLSENTLRLLGKVFAGIVAAE